jgi:UPF0755 protein
MVRRKISRKAPAALRVAIGLITAAVVVAIFVLLKLYTTIFSPAVVLTDENSAIFFVSTGSDYNTVVDDLQKSGHINDLESFDWLAKKKKYDLNVKPGRYRLINGMSNNDLVNLLRSGRQEPVDLVFNNVRTTRELAGIISRQLEPDSLEFLKAFTDTSIIHKFGFSAETFPSIFIPNTYEFYWNTSTEKFLERMNHEYKVFWLDERLKKAEKLKLKPAEVITLASIIDQEALHNDENPTIAGVFINRLKQGMPLQSDPTIIFAWQDFSMRRVLNKHKDIKSPYNTYKNRGLPPGPISIPSISAIDAVLNYEKHNYLYFCAKDDFSGYHNFARTLSEHNRNARLYQQALNKRRIFN